MIIYVDGITHKIACGDNPKVQFNYECIVRLSGKNPNNGYLIKYNLENPPGHISNGEMRHNEEIEIYRGTQPSFWVTPN